MTSGSFAVAGEGLTRLYNLVLQFQDRTYKLNSIPTELQGAYYFQGPCHSNVMTLRLDAVRSSEVWFVQRLSVAVHWTRNVTSLGHRSQKFSCLIPPYLPPCLSACPPPGPKSGWSVTLLLFER